MLVVVGTVGGGCGGADAVLADAGAPNGDAGPFVGPVRHCPGDPGCPSASGPLEAGASAVDVTPALASWETEWTDVNGDACFDPGDDTFVDTNGNQLFDALWLAGFCNGRPATGVETPIFARALALRQGETSIAVVYVDVIGQFDRAVAAITDDPRTAALGFDLVIVGSTHNHQAPDSAGLWDDNQLESGVDLDFAAGVREGAIAALVAAHADLQPVTMSVAQVNAVDPATGSAAPYVSDARDPMIFDPALTLVRFASVAEPGTTVATLVNFAAHPEYVGDGNNLITSDFVGYLRDGVERGFPKDGVPGLGGVAVFVQGALGGQIGPVHAAPLGPDGPIDSAGHDKARHAGWNLARLGLDALADDGEDVSVPALAFKSADIVARADNTALTTLTLLGILDHTVVGYDENRPIGPGNEGWLPLVISMVQIGPVAFVTAPGELHPELWVGGYDGAWSWGQELLPEPVNRPDLGLAPAPPYLRDVLLAEPGVRYVFVAGLAHDFVGYIVAGFNFVLDEDNPYFEEAEGEHYEETNSLGPDAERQIVGPLFELVRWRPTAP